MIYNRRLPFLIFFPSPCVIASMQRTSIEFHRSIARARVFSVPLISIFLPTANPAVRRLLLATVLHIGVYLSLFLPAATTVTGDYGKAMRRDRDNGCIACVRGGDIRGSRGRKQTHAEVSGDEKGELGTERKMSEGRR